MPRMQGLTSCSLGYSQGACLREEVTSSSGTQIRFAYRYYNKESSQAQGSFSVIHHPAHKCIRLGPLNRPCGTWRGLSQRTLFLTKESQLPQWLSSKKNPLAIKEMQVWSLGQEDSLGVAKGNSLQYPCLGNPMDRGAWQVTAPGSQSQTWFRD